MKKDIMDKKKALEIIGVASFVLDKLRENFTDEQASSILFAILIMVDKKIGRSDYLLAQSAIKPLRSISVEHTRGTDEVAEKVDMPETDLQEESLERSSLPG